MNDVNKSRIMAVLTFFRPSVCDGSHDGSFNILRLHEVLIVDEEFLGVP
jgi:hypothetical protein